MTMRDKWNGWGGIEKAAGGTILAAIVLAGISSIATRGLNESVHAQETTHLKDIAKVREEHKDDIAAVKDAEEKDRRELASAIADTNTLLAELNGRLGSIVEALPKKRGH